MDNPFALFGIIWKNGATLLAAFACLGLGIAAGLVVVEWLGIGLAFVGGLLLTPFMRSYAGLLHGMNRVVYRVFQALIVVGVPVNFAVFLIRGPPPDLFPAEDGFAATFQTIGIAGWGFGGMIATALGFLLFRPQATE